MRDMVMQMTGSNGVLSVPSEHLPGLIALVLLGPVTWLALACLRGLAARGVGWAVSGSRRLHALPFAAQVALFAMLVGAVVHAVIVPTHWGDARVTAILFVVDTIGFAVAFWWTLNARRHWRLVAAAMLGGTACFYALYILKGWETMDLVGLVTTTVEAAGALVLLSPTTSIVPARQRAMAIAAVPVALLSLLGTNLIASATSASATTTVPSPASPSATARGSASGGSVARANGAAMPGMSAGGSSSGKVTALSLPTDSPAGSIAWPDDMSTMAAGMEMAEPDCTAQPTAQQQRAAVEFVNQTVAAAQKYTSLAAAEAAGYVPVTQRGARIVHYINPAIYRSETSALDPSAIPSLVYVNTGHGAVLAAAMYLTPRGTTPPQPGGCLTQWHIHTDLCFSGGRVVGTDAGSSCAAGSVNQVTQPMMHVWMVPVTGGPLAADPPAVSEVEAAAQAPPPNPPNATA
jgi:hypothetical protein